MGVKKDLSQSVSVPAIRQVVIENPIINSPFDEPSRHFKFSDEGITNEEVDGRRTSSYFVLSQRQKRRAPSNFSLTPNGRKTASKRTSLSTTSVGGRTVAEGWLRWCDADHCTPDRLLDRSQPREEIVLLSERGPGNSNLHHRGSKEIRGCLDREQIREANETSNPGLPRIAFKMATGSGKTVVMAMLIAWHTLNKRANPQDARFSRYLPDCHTGHHHPGPTTRVVPERPRELLPPAGHRSGATPGSSDRPKSSSLTTTLSNCARRSPPAKSRSRSRNGKPNPFTETPDQMVRRVCRELSTKKNIVVLNDEAHHCYRRKPDARRMMLDRRRAKRCHEARRRSTSLDFWIRSRQGEDRRP